ncbi:hypothetical protein TGDOM2_264700 [Toxoplasma gondii GAB2-2007-GAL-DOM2]|uniref:EF-hand domain-containing protein n=8 Tax=Toxoplasma gondii TaxID=5811 RepID=A0A125YWK5_TOXGV|nr:hypothetical protein TGGT1_264700 [Toxoplasma gondii GT1]ESS33594.1 hypothetical protein TGVEG_264700 [Toxoplasma gondii VEG]KAF4644282.1 hypothetical protein TGRH88_012740 [Toxoplasma gondii]KFG32496.1 hypothetical protein TGP89_264700 [Toxoplasma gondii p89]KFG38375.1 hypothetical protein TGDOM2_264700 [Toxoplasma gondii GAB2-2007-GAL-DOM2]KFG42443.1 hypothetical protein TGFOU_264700 [Toxoplasma gondii FOU]RQX73942.1 hypothetical protein TGCAST_264700 [Toxoplasma gondii CAST]
MPGSVSSFEGIDSGGLAPNPDRSTPLSGASSGITGLLEGSQNDAERIQNAIKEAFQLLDANRCGRIVAEEAPHLLRYLGFFPSEEEIASRILPQVISKSVVILVQKIRDK